MIKILASTPTKSDGTSYYRAYGVFNQLAKIIPIEITDYFSRPFQWPDLKGFDILFLHRPFRADLIPVCEYCNNLGIKIWIDYDDNLFQLPQGNPAFDNYTDEVKGTMFKILKLADVVTTSTEDLRIFFDKMGIFNCQTVPNALDEKFSPLATSFNEKKNYFWRGSATHFEDLYDYQTEIFNAIESSEAQWYFFGWNPFFITRIENATKKVKYIKPADIIHYFKNIVNLKPHIMHVPLSFNLFNQCKSNIAWIEATMAGGVCIGPDWQEWDKPGVIRYQSAEQYEQLLKSPPENLESYWKQSRDYIQENLLLSVVNKQRKQIIENLL